jgi:hypothetical protein
MIDPILLEVGASGTGVLNERHAMARLSLCCRTSQGGRMTCRKSAECLPNEVL